MHKGVNCSQSALICFCVGLSTSSAWFFLGSHSVNFRWQILSIVVYNSSRRTSSRKSVRLSLQAFFLEPHSKVFG